MSLGKRGRDEGPAALPSPNPTQQPPEKKFKLDENDIDFLIGDLTKEESQLVITRLLRKVGEETLRTQIEIVRHARNQVTQDQIDKQMAQLKQLTEMRNAMPASPMFLPFGSPSGLAEGIPFEGFGSPHGGGGGAGVSSGRLRAIKNRVRDSFKKRRDVPNKTHAVKLDSLEEDISKVKDYVAKGSMKNALVMLEAITEEFADRVAEIAQDNIVGIENALEQLGNHWLDLFLADCYDLSEDEREEWYEKIRSWDTSAVENGALTTAKWAAKYGWQDETLKQILSGEQPPEGESFKFEEPKALTIARLNILERDKKFQEAYNLAQALDMGLYTSKFLMRMNKIDEAVAAALKLTDASKIYSIAQIARPIDLNAAFRLAGACFDRCWNNWRLDRAQWLADLAITEKKMDLLVETFSAVRVKTIQFEMVKLLASKNRPLEAFQLAEVVLRPYTLDELSNIHADLMACGLKPEMLPEESAVLNQREYLDIIPECRVQPNYVNWLWTTADSTLTLAEKAAQDPTAYGVSSELVPFLPQLKGKPDEELQVILTLTDSAEALISLIHSCIQREAFTNVEKIGSQALDLILSQEKENREFQEQGVTIDFKNKQAATEAAAAGLPIPVPTKIPEANFVPYNFLEKKKTVCLLMLEAALKHKESFKIAEAKRAEEQQKNASSSSSATATGDDAMAVDVEAVPEETEAEKQERLQKLEECSQVLKRITELAVVKVCEPDTLLELAKKMSERQEFRLALRIAHTAFHQVSTLRKKREEVDRQAEEFAALQYEVNSLLSQKLKPEPAQIEEFRKLSLQRELTRIAPLHEQCTVTQYIRKWFLVAHLIVRTAIASKQADEVEERIEDAEIQSEIDSVLQYVLHPNNLVKLVECVVNLQEHLLVQYIAPKVAALLETNREEWMKRVVLEIEIQQLLDEQEDLQVTSSRDLDTPQKERLDELKQQLEALPPRTMYELATFDEYQAALWNLYNWRMNAALARKSALQKEITVVASSIDNSEERVAQLQTELEKAEQSIDQVLQIVLDNVTSPLYLHELMTLIRSERLNQIPRIAARSLEIIDELQQHSRTLLQPIYELQQLRQEKQTFRTTPPQQRKPLPAENVAKLRTLSLEEAMRQVAQPLDRSLGATQLSCLAKRTMCLLVDSIQSRQMILFNQLNSTRTRELQVQAELKSKEAMMSDTDKKVQRKALDEMASQFTEFSTELSSLKETMNHAIEQVMTRATDPHTLYQIANDLRAPQVDTYEFVENKENLQHKAKLMLTIPALVEQLEQERKSRVDTYERRQNLVTEQAELSALLKFPDEKVAELASLNKQVWLWEADVSYKNMKADDHVRLIFQAFQQLLSQLYSVSNQLKRELVDLDNAENNARSLMAHQHDGSGDVAMGGQEELDSVALADFTRQRSVKNGHVAIIEQQINTAMTAALKHIVNPAHLNSLATVLHNQGVGVACEQVVQLSNAVFPLATELRAEIQRRTPLEEELEELVAEEEELKAVKKTLQPDPAARLAHLRHLQFHWEREPSHTQGSLDTINDMIYQASHNILRSLMSYKNQLTQVMTELTRSNLVASDDNSSAMTGNVKEIEEQEQKIAQLDVQLQAQTTTILAQLRAPNHFQDIIKFTLSNSEFDLAFVMAKVAQDKILEYDNYRQRLCDMARKVFLLEVEQYLLVEEREALEPKRAKLLENYRKEFDAAPDLNFGVDFDRNTDSMRLPNSFTQTKPADNSQLYCTRELDATYRRNNLVAIFNGFLQKLKNWEATMEAEENMGLTHSKSDLESSRAELLQQIDTALEYCFTNVVNPLHLFELLNVAKRHGQHDLMVRIADRAIRQMDQVRKQAEEKLPVDAERKKLEAKQTELKGQRKDLPKDEKERLRDLQWDANMAAITPDYQRLSVLQCDNNIWNVYHEILDHSLRHKQEVDAELDVVSRTPHLVRGKSSWTEAQIKDYVKDTESKSRGELDLLMDLATKFISNEDHLTLACRTLNEFKQYPELIKIGTHAQSILKEKVKLKIIFEELTKELQEERERLPPSTMDNDVTLSLAKELEEIAAQVSSKSQAQLRQNILSIADMMIDAARIEKMSDVVKEEAILVFKMTLTIAKFEEVHTLVSPSEWPDIRKDLLDYVASYNAALPGSAITIKEQIELLLREGLWKEATQLLPDAPLPSHYDFDRKATEYIALLEMLWYEMERISPDHLKILLPIIEEFAKKEFAQQRIDTMDRLLDGVQNQFPDFILPLYEHASEQLLSNCSNAKQYKLYCSFAATVKRRLMDLGLKADWKAFITEVRQKNVRKKNLIKQLDVNDLKP